MKYRSYMIAVLLTINFVLGQNKVFPIEQLKKKFKYSKTTNYDVKAFRDFIYEKKLISSNEVFNNKDSTLTLYYNSEKKLISKEIVFFDKNGRTIAERLHIPEFVRINEYEYFNNNILKKKINYHLRTFPFIKTIEEFNIQGEIVKKSELDENNNLRNFSVYNYDDNFKLTESERFDVKYRKNYLIEAVLYHYNKNELIEKESYNNYGSSQDIGLSGIKFEMKDKKSTTNEYSELIYEKKFKGLDLKRKTIYVNDLEGYKTEIEIENDRTNISLKTNNIKKNHSFGIVKWNNPNGSVNSISNWISTKDFYYSYNFDVNLMNFKRLETIYNINENSTKKIEFIKEGELLENYIITNNNTKYEYDEFGNWIKEKQYIDGNLIKIIEREISY
jgi:hypothetical protein